MLPVSLNQAKAHLYIDTTDTDHDSYINTLINVAVSESERFTGRRFVSQTWKAFVQAWPACDFIELPFGQLQSVTHVKYTDSDGAESTLSTEDYIVDTDSDPGRVILAYGESWPTVTLYPSNPIEIQFVCGFYHGDEWSESNTYAENDIVLPTAPNGLAYQSGGAGDSDAAEPTWPTTIGGTVVDNEVTWTCIGETVPQEICHAIKLHISDNFDNRSSQYINAGFLNSYNSKAFESLLWPQKIYLKQRI